MTDLYTKAARATLAKLEPRLKMFTITLPTKKTAKKKRRVSKTPKRRWQRTEKHPMIDRDLKKVISETCAKHVIRLDDADQDIIVRAIIKASSEANERLSRDLQRIDRLSK